MSNDTDIIAAIAPDAVSLMDKAIAEIKRLRQENATLTDENELLRSTVTDCRIEIERLTAERDEARREVCVMLEDATNNHRENHAKRWGWDCFKEDGK